MSLSHGSRLCSTICTCVCVRARTTYTLRLEYNKAMWCMVYTCLLAHNRSSGNTQLLNSITETDTHTHASHPFACIHARLHMTFQCSEFIQINSNTIRWLNNMWRVFATID